MYLAMIKSILAKVVTKKAGICLLFTAKEIISYILSYKKYSVWQYGVRLNFLSSSVADLQYIKGLDFEIDFQKRI